MRQPESLDIGTKMDVARRRLDIAKEGIAFKKHKDTLSYFNKNYVQPEIFPRELGRKIVKAEEIRHASDYDTFYIASKEITAQQIETAAKILELAEGYLAGEEAKGSRIIPMNEELTFIHPDVISNSHTWIAFENERQ